MKTNYDRENELMREELIARLEEHKTALKEVILKTSEKAVDAGKNAALVGGVVLGSIVVMSLLFGTGRRGRNKNFGSGFINLVIVPMASILAQQGAQTFMRLAREKLTYYLADKKKEHEAGNSSE